MNFDMRDKQDGLRPEPFWAKYARTPLKTAGIILGALFLLLALNSSIYTVQETDRGVVLTGGKFSEVVGPGINFKIPFIQSVKMISLQTWNDKFSSLAAYSNDQQPATMKVSVTWQANPAKIVELYRTALDLNNVTDRYITPQIPTQLENTFGQFSAENVVQKRDSFVAALKDKVSKTVPDFITIVSLQVEDINFSDAYEGVIEEKAKAEVAVATAGKREARAVIDARASVAQAQGEADSDLARKRAEITAISERGAAEASAITAKANALRANPNLIQLIEAERWNGSRATTIFGAATPLVNTK